MRISGPGFTPAGQYPVQAPVMPQKVPYKGAAPIPAGPVPMPQTGPSHNPIGKKV